MAHLSKTLNTALAASKPHHNKKLSQECFKTARQQKDSAEFLDTAGKAFENNDSVEGLRLLQHARDCLDRKD